MLFHSPEYLLLLVGCIGVVFAVPHRMRWVFLLAASYGFYGYWRLEYVALLLVSTGIDYFCGLGLGRFADGPRRKALLGLSLTANMAILGYFKYRLFLGDALGVIVPTADPGLWRAADFVLPVGLSFYTLQSMGYSIDVYRRRRPPERHAGYFALYVAYFPQLIAGPIERAGRLLPQLRACRPFDWDNLRSGCLLFLFGLAKKLVVADNMAPAIGALYGDPGAMAPADVLLLVLVSPIYLLMDFSAYTDMARGSARMMGVELSQNFKLPMAAHSIRDFWKRWHITLSQWIFDYLYAPLVRRSRNPAFSMAALWLTFVVIGLWHGPSWSFILFGAFHGTLAVLEMIVDRSGLHWPEGQVWHRLRQARTYVLNSLSTVLFLAGSMGIATSVYVRLGELPGAPLVPAVAADPRFVLALAMAAGAGMVHRLMDRRALDREILGWPTAARWALYYGLVFAVLILGATERQAFVYFQF